MSASKPSGGAMEAAWALRHEAARALRSSTMYDLAHAFDSFAARARAEALEGAAQAADSFGDRVERQLQSSNSDRAVWAAGYSEAARLIGSHLRSHASHLRALARREQERP